MPETVPRDVVFSAVQGCAKGFWKNPPPRLDNVQQQKETRKGKQYCI